MPQQPTQRLDKLLTIVGPGLADPVDRAAARDSLAALAADVGVGGISGVGESILDELADLLATRNGLYGFVDALHVLPLGGPQASQRTDGAAQTVERWNRADGWRAGYGGLAEELLFFAEDAFGGQFAIRRDEVVTFDPETGDVEPLGPSLEIWADALLTDDEVLTGYPLAHDWQSAHGVLAPGRRLVPRRPFVLGGAFAVDNLVDVDAGEGMLQRAQLATAIRDLPDGAQLRWPLS